MNRERRGTLVSDEDFWVMVGELDLPCSYIVSFCRNTVGPAAKARAELLEMTPGWFTDEENEDFARKVRAAEGVIEEFGHLPEPP